MNNNRITCTFQYGSQFDKLHPQSGTTTQSNNNTFDTLFRYREKARVMKVLPSLLRLLICRCNILELLNSNLT